jgi:hypothetical protein
LNEISSYISIGNTLLSKMSNHRFELKQAIKQYFGAENVEEIVNAKINFIKLCQNCDDFILLFEHKYLKKETFVNNNRNKIIACICANKKFFILDYLIKLGYYQINELINEITYMFTTIISCNKETIHYFLNLDTIVTITAINFIECLCTRAVIIIYIIKNKLIKKQDVEYWLQTTDNSLIKNLLLGDAITSEFCIKTINNKNYVSPLHHPA